MTKLHSPAQMASRASSRAIVVELRKVMEPLIPGFLEHRRHDVARLREAIERMDHRSVWDIGHNLKGLGATYGFPVITDVGLALEHAAEREDTHSVRHHTETLSDYLRRVDVVYV